MYGGDRIELGGMTKHFNDWETVSFVSLRPSMLNIEGLKETKLTVALGSSH